MTKSYTYDYMGRVLTETSPKGGVTSYEYDELGNLLVVWEPNGYIDQYIYDLAGRKVGYLPPLTTKGYYYDELDRLIKTENNIPGYPTEEEKTYYDLNSNVVATKTKVSENNYIENTFMYDDVGRLLAETSVGDTENQVTQYQYDSVGRLHKMITGLTSYQETPTYGKVTTYQYDAQNRIYSITDPMGNSETYSSYDRQGNLLAKTDRNGSVWSYTYCTYGLLTESVTGEETIYHEYDYANLATYTYQGAYGWYEEGFDEYGRLRFINEEDSYGYGYSYTYDKNSNVTGVSYGTGNTATNLNITYAYNDANILTSMTEGGETYTYSYSPERYLQNITTDNYAVEMENYYGRLDSKANYGGGLDSPFHTKFYYTYTNDGRILSEQQVFDGNDMNGEIDYFPGNMVTRNYTYDKMGRLITEDVDNFDYTYSFTYDSNGNRVTMSVTDTSNCIGNYNESYTYDANNRMTSKTRTEDGVATTTTYTYDNNGNLLTEQTGDKTKTYTYDKKNRMISYTADGVTAAYTYYLSGKRQSKTVNGVTTYFGWMGDNLASETTGTTVKRYVYDQTGVVKTYTGTTANYSLKDGRGNVETTTDNSGAVDKQVSYTAFGEQIDTNLTESGLYYSGEYYDVESGLIYLRNRYYNPETGRFTTEDPHWNINNMIYGDKEYEEGEIRTPDVNAILQSSNLYSYCINDPVNYRDPSGEGVAATASAIGGFLFSPIGQQVISGVQYYGTIAYGYIVNYGTQIVYTVGNFGGAVVDGITDVINHISNNSEKLSNSSNQQNGGNANNVKPNLKTIDNKTANDLSVKNGFKDAHEFKQYFVGKENISKYNMKIDKNTGEIFLESVQKGGNIIATGYFR